MPADVQEKMLRTIPGLENVDMIRPGYGVEYDCIDARELKCMYESSICVCLTFPRSQQP